jgi:SAM-dependent methyltransferase
MDRAETSLRDAWEQGAGEWIRWARSPQLDHAFWRMNLPALISLLPAPHGRTLDIGCGEGRVARALKERGYDVVGIDSSATLARAAHELDSSFDIEVADAAAMPFPDGHFELAVASLSLMNMDDMPAVITEIARVLRGGGLLCLSVLHPISTWGRTGRSSYFATVRYSECLNADGASATVHDTHRPVHTYFDALAQAGFLVEKVLEPAPDEAYLAAVPAASRWRDSPGFLHLRAVSGSASRGGA